MISQFLTFLKIKKSKNDILKSKIESINLINKNQSTETKNSISSIIQKIEKDNALIYKLIKTSDTFTVKTDLTEYSHDVYDISSTLDKISFNLDFLNSLKKIEACIEVDMKAAFINALKIDIKMKSDALLGQFTLLSIMIQEGNIDDEKGLIIVKEKIQSIKDLHKYYIQCLDLL